MTGWILLALCIATSAGASVFLKLGAASFSETPNLQGLLYSPMVWVGGGCYALAFVGYIFTLRLVPLSLVQPVITAGVSVITCLVAVIGFREYMGIVNWAGLALVCMGVLFLFWGRA